MNSSLADAHNLSYKIAAVQQGWGTKKLLNSYQGDRHRAATINTMLSLNNSHTIFNLLDRLGVNDPDIAVARENLAKSLADPKQRESMRAGVREQQEDFDNVSLSGIVSSTETDLSLARAPHWSCLWRQVSSRRSIALQAPVSGRSPTSACVDKTA